MVEGSAGPVNLKEANRVECHHCSLWSNVLKIDKRRLNLKPRTDEEGWSRRAIWTSFAILLSFTIGGFLTKGSVEPLAWPEVGEPILSQEMAGVVGGEIYGTILFLNRPIRSPVTP